MRTVLSTLSGPERDEVANEDKCIWRRTESLFVLLNCYYYGHEVKRNETDETWTAHGEGG
jgi:hypothetical protein